MFVLDTNTLIYFFKGVGQVAERLLAVSPREIGIPAVVLFELEVGLAKSTDPRKRQQQLADMVTAVEILPFSTVEAREAAKIRAHLEQIGEPIGPYDVLIAATAKANGGTLITHNVKEFGRVPDLSLADWYE